MNPTPWRLIVFVSCAHALAHVFELSLPGVEEEIAEDYGVTKAMMGWMAACWRTPWGFGALLAGWLVDHYGGKRMLTIYLLGCAAACLVAGFALPLPILFVVMFSMGALASIYHPAGLALISHETDAENRPMALGIHGVFGSIGVGFSPLLAGMVLRAGWSWQQYYWLLAGLGGVLGLFFLKLAMTTDEVHLARQNTGDVEEPPAAWRCFYLLTVIALIQGFVYSGLMSFLPRYFNNSALTLPFFDGVGVGQILAGLVLTLGCAGQMLAGTIARASKLELQLTAITFGNAPFLFWMAVAGGWSSVAAAGLFALVHFMHQPIYNSLVAKYTPRGRRSLCYGFSFAMSFGIGGFGAAFAGYIQSRLISYATFSAATLLSGLLCALLWLWSRNLPTSE